MSNTFNSISMKCRVCVSESGRTKKRALLEIQFSQNNMLRLDFSHFDKLIESNRRRN